MNELEIEWLAKKSDESEVVVKDMIHLMVKNKIDTISFMADYGEGYTINSYDNYNWFEVAGFTPFE